MKSALRHILLLSMSLAGISGARAASLDEARRLMEDGDAEAAVAVIREVAAAEPKNSEADILLGDCLWQIGRDSEALEAYAEGRRKGDRMAILALANAAVLQYRLDDARGLLEAYRKTLKKGKRQLAPDQSGDIEDRILRTENMLARVQQIEVVDSVVVDAEDFFRYYRLSPESGSLNEPSAVLPEDFAAAEPTVVYEPESRRQMIWSMPDTAGVFRLVSSGALYGDSWEKPAPLGDVLNDGGDANYPFLMPDGVTLYYASDGENSLGGYDIFISRCDDEGEFLQPANIGMTYNSPYNDYLLAIDELTGAGWWASDRNRIPGKVTIYLFIPQELRVNVSPDAPDLLARASLSSIRSTWQEGADYRPLLRSIAAINPGGSKERAADFQLSIPGRGVVTNYAQLHSPRSRALMKDYVDSLRRFDKAMERLGELRMAYAKGDRSVSDAILQAEARIDQARGELLDMRNEIIRLEQ
ncbi:MAG: tetratricopeptide repeat protein [Muribaculaceae bacterium]|nr:tetratricopeptide repeat protein [Muribaculaceae bacterium]